MRHGEWNQLSQDQQRAIKEKFAAIIKAQQLSQKEAAEMCDITEKAACDWVNELGLQAYKRKARGNGNYSYSELRELRKQLIICVAIFKLNKRLSAQLLGITPHTAGKWEKQMGGKCGIYKRYVTELSAYRECAIQLCHYIMKLSRYEKYHEIAEMALQKLTNNITNDQNQLFPYEAY